MAQERLSKLQKWVLLKCLEFDTLFENILHKNDALEFYDKKILPSVKGKAAQYIDKNGEWGTYDWCYFKLPRKDTDRYLEIREKETRGGKKKYKYIKDEFIATDAEMVSISWTFSNLIKKGLLKRLSQWGGYYLTEKGFLKVNGLRVDETKLNYKDYWAKVEPARKEQEVRKKRRAEKDRRKELLETSDEYLKKVRQLSFKLRDFQKKYTIDNVFNLCCDDCKRKVIKFRKECGDEYLKKVRQQSFKLSDSQKKYTIDNVFNLCCDNCKRKVIEFRKECGEDELKRLKDELDAML